MDDSNPADLPDVVVDEQRKSVVICGSTKWKSVRDLASLFVAIMSHESLHLTLLKFDGRTSDRLDEVASLSAISRNLRNLALVGKYVHGMIGLDV